MSIRKRNLCVSTMVPIILIVVASAQIVTAQSFYNHIWHCIPLGARDSGNRRVIVVQSPCLLVGSSRVIGRSLDIRFNLPRKTCVTISLQDLYGRLISVLIDRSDYDEGFYQIETDATGLPSGIYSITLRSGEGITAQRVLVSH